MPECIYITAIILICEPCLFISSPRRRRRSNIPLNLRGVIGAVCAARSAKAQTVTIAETG
jgi:hypothetical protein